MPLSIPIKDLVDDDDNDEVEIDIPTKKSKGKKFHLDYKDPLIIFIASFVTLNVNFENLNIIPYRVLDSVGEVPIRAVIISILFLLLKFIYEQLLTA